MFLTCTARSLSDELLQPIHCPSCFSNSCFVLQSRYNSSLLLLTLCLSLDEFQMVFLHPWNKSVQLNRFTEDPLKRLLANGACNRSKSEVLDLFEILPGMKHSVTLRYFSCLYVILGFIKTNVLYIILLFFQFQFFFVLVRLIQF